MPGLPAPMAPRHASSQLSQVVTAAISRFRSQRLRTMSGRQSGPLLCGALTEGACFGGLVEADAAGIAADAAGSGATGAAGIAANSAAAGATGAAGIAANSAAAGATGAAESVPDYVGEFVDIFSYAHDVYEGINYEIERSDKR